MRLQHPFEAVTTSVDGDCLSVLARAEHEFSAARLVSLLGRKRSLTGVRNALDRLATQGIVDVRHVGNVKSYALNRSHLLAPAIIAIATARERLIDAISTELGEWAEAPVFGALFGSAARGEMQVDSDIDVLLVHAEDCDIEAWSDQVMRLHRMAEKWTGNDTRVLTIGEREVDEHGSNDPVLHEIAREGIVLIGPTSWLRRRMMTTA